MSGRVYPYKMPVVFFFLTADSVGFTNSHCDYAPARPPCPFFCKYVLHNSISASAFVIALPKSPFLIIYSYCYT